jgi:hypothetical protein
MLQNLPVGHALILQKLAEKLQLQLELQIKNITLSIAKQTQNI